MSAHLSDEEQVEALKKWWKENGKGIIGGLVIGLVGVFGWRYWQTQLTTAGEQASMTYMEMVHNIHEGKSEVAIGMGKHLVTKADKTPYAALASLLLAKLAVEAEDFEKAAEHLRWAMDNGSLPELKQTARLRLTRLLLSQGKPDEALPALTGTEGEESASYHELRGDIMVAQDQSSEAREAYTQAIALSPPGAEVKLLQMKLDDLSQTQTGSGAEQ